MASPASRKPRQWTEGLFQSSSHNWMLVKQSHQQSSKFQKISSLRVKFPVDPGDLVILAIRIIVAAPGEPER
jgi:hypothetical protein